MTEPGPSSRVPLKVVPIYIDEVVVPEPAEVPDPPAPREPRPKTPLIGAAAAGLAIVAGVLQGLAIAIATGGDYAAATILTYFAVAVASAAVVGGVVGVVLHRGRRWGIAAIVAGLVANPLILLAILRLVG